MPHPCHHLHVHVLARRSVLLVYACEACGGCAKGPAGLRLGWCRAGGPTLCPQSPQCRRCPPPVAASSPSTPFSDAVGTIVLQAKTRGPSPALPPQKCLSLEARCAHPTVVPVPLPLPCLHFPAGWDDCTGPPSHRPAQIDLLQHDGSAGGPGRSQSPRPRAPPSIFRSGGVPSPTAAAPPLQQVRAALCHHP